MKLNFKKMLGTISLLTLAVPTTLSVVACGGPAENAQTDLKNIIKETTIAGSIDETTTSVINKIVALNKGLTKDDIDVKDLERADYKKDGKAVIFAKVAKFTGEVKITITGIPVPKIEKILDEVRDKIYEDVHIASKEPAQVFELTEEQLKLSDEQIKEILSTQIFVLLTTKHPELKGLVKEFKIADIEDWGNRKREWPTGEEIREAIASKGMWVPEQRSDNEYKLLTVGFRITDIDGNQSPAPHLGKGVDDNGDISYPDSFGILWNVNIGIKQK